MGTKTPNNEGIVNETLFIRNQHRLVDLIYILGISLLISAIIFFFAANWQGIGREAKVALISVLVVLFHLIGWMLSKWMPHRQLIGKLFIFAGTISFGVAVALIGQTYNSHADNYVIFLIWLVPTLVMSVITRFQPYFILSYILFHFTVFFYLFPSSYFFIIADERIIISLILLSLGNVLLFELIRRGKIASKTLLYGSFIMFHLIWIVLTTRWAFEEYELLLNGAYLFLLLGTLYLFIQIVKQRHYIVLSSIFVAYFIIRWLFRWMWEFDSSWFFIFVLLFSASLVYFNIKFIKWLAKRTKQKAEAKDTEKSSETIEESNQLQKPWWQRLLIGLVSATSATLGTAGIIGISVLIFDDILSMFYVVGGVGLLLVVIYRHDRIDETVKQTLVFVGLLIVTIFSWDIHWVLSVMVLAVFPFVWNSVSTWLARSFVIFTGNLFIMITTLSYELSFETTLLMLVLLNAALAWGVSRLIEKEDHDILKVNGFFYSLFFFFILTFFGDSNEWTYYVYNVGFFAITTYFAFYYMKKDEKEKSFIRITYLFWFGFLFYKYYDIVWQLLHKSIALALIGIVFLLIAIFLDLKRPKMDQAKGEGDWLQSRKLILISVLLLLQISFIGFQYYQSEQALAEGDLIKLELEDNYLFEHRSELQGDYVYLRYSISYLDESIEELDYGERIQIVLRENEAGFHEYAGIYIQNGEYNTAYEPKETDVHINGTALGWREISYGIETYFIEEATSQDLLELGNHASIRVATNGNAIIVGLNN